ncbi:MAG TPA: hypothetical protein VF173_32895 [Thermoanaerobaculia bacterium]|nr:hypothetical protein [Thermoanaerobaculia bacterium]
MSQRIPRLVFAAVSGLLAFGGCSSHRQLATQAVDFNLTVEKAQNEMLLLNVIRAKDRLPMYMTGIASLSGNFQTSFSTGTGLSYSHSASTMTRGATASASATLSANPSFSLAVLDTQEFMRGFLNPINLDMLGYYWSQEWPRPLLLYLLVQRAEIESPAGTLVLRNYPDSTDAGLGELTRFGCAVRDFLARNPGLKTKTFLDDVGPQLPETAVSDVAKLIQISQGGFQLGKGSAPGTYQLKRTRTEQHFTLEDKPAFHPSSGCGDADLISILTKPTGAGAKAEGSPAAPETYQDSAAAGKIRVTLGDSKTTLTLVLRSPEALLYYLGELTRVANRKESPKIPYVCIQHRFQPLFVALPAGRCQGSQVVADAGKGRFSVPAVSDDGLTEGKCDDGDIRLEDANHCEAGRSMHTLRLLSQILSMQKSAKDLPSTGVVRLLN